MIEQITGMLALIGVLSLLCQWIGWQLRLPAILPLLCCGLVIGPGLGWLDPDAIFGDLLFPLISLGVAVILFEGALTLNFKEIRDHGRMVTHLVTVGAMATWLVISVASWWLFEFSSSLALLFGALVVVTGPTVIVPMLRTVRPKSELASILRWEGIIIDPIGALIAVLVYEYITVSSDQTSHVLTALGSMLSIGLGIGALAGYVLGWILRRNILPHYLTNTAVLTITLGVFVGSNLLQEESGLLTVTVMGIWLANMRGVAIQAILEFKETLTVLLISALFILLAARLDSDAMLSLGWQGGVLLLIVLFIARPLSIWLSGIGTSLQARDKWFLSWIAPRGIVAAAVSSLFAIKLEQKGMEGADMLVPLVFLIIIGTVVIQSLTALSWAKRLGVTAKSAQGFLIFGGSKFARELAKILVSKGIKVIIADSNWDNVRLARMDNIQVYFGNPVSEHADTYLDLSGIGKVLILSPYQQLNPVVFFHFQDLFGPEKVFGVSTTDSSGSARHQLSESYLRRMCLFDESVSYSKLASLMNRDAVLKTTNLTENFSYQDFIERYGDTVVPLIYVKAGKVHMITADMKTFPTGVELISLIPKEASEHQQKKAAEEKELKEQKEQSEAAIEVDDAITPNS
ncbi:cation:proton antiporter [Shewanella sp. A3A]|uniref:Cation:proton antiporter n=1 Tax=Shewanella electrica TaxID=515560 RepID=A0ABT2FT66_9GAMM|nr:sodium:proton antiporter [Shewanella electrica]MCH1921566.1 cation:proton antiporter [Shewanella ferrihydritica]MCH1926848.1 cation:proton antiporter [Shewanella electrica]MCS4558409.1 cation:proton antiporter [Shewanella electrica]